MYDTVVNLIAKPGACLLLMVAIYAIGKFLWYFINDKGFEYTGNKLALYDMGEVFRLDKKTMKFIEDEVSFFGELIIIAVTFILHMVLSIAWPLYILVVTVLGAKVYRRNLREKDSE